MIDRIALSGPLYSGKSTLAHALEEEGYMYLNFAHHLKGEACKALAAVGVRVTVERMEQSKGLYRTFLQSFGDVIDFSTNPRYVLEVLRPWIERGCADPVVFDNVRTAEQFAVLDDYGFSLVELTISPDLQEHRAYLKGVTPEQLRLANAHPVEQGVGRPEWVALRLDAALPTKEQVRRLIGEESVAHVA